jgi:hypothetical protein
VSAAWPLTEHLDIDDRAEDGEPVSNVAQFGPDGPASDIGPLSHSQDHWLPTVN